MPELLRMPEVAAGTTEAVLASWPLAEGSSFSAKDVLLTIETDKAVVDVEAEADGVLLKTLVTEGAEVQVGNPIALIGAAGEKVDDIDAALTSLGVASGTGAAGPSVAPEAPAGDAHEEAQPVPAATANGRVRTFASPLARRLAREAGLMVDDVPGTGPGGRIVRRDVEAALAARVAREEAADSPAVQGDLSGAPVPALTTPTPPTSPSPAPTRSAVPAPPVPVPAAPSEGGYVDQPLSRVRKAIAARLTESKTTAPHFYLRGTARVDKLLALRAELNAAGGVKVSVNDLVVKAVARAHTLVPAMNVVWNGDSIRAFSGVDVAVAVATENGLVTPVLRSADSLSITATARATQDFVARARAGRLQQAELQGGSISVTNLGMYGTEEFAAILNPPHAAILAVGAARKEAVVVDDRLEVGTVMRVTLSVDHRPVDGATAAQWMQALVTLLEAPVRIIA